MSTKNPKLCHQIKEHFVTLAPNKDDDDDDDDSYYYYHYYYS